jgi:hypothetical protein
MYPVSVHEKEGQALHANVAHLLYFSNISALLPTTTGAPFGYEITKAGVINGKASAENFPAGRIAAAEAELQGQGWALIMAH